MFGFRGGFFWQISSWTWLPTSWGSLLEDYDNDEEVFIHGTGLPNFWDSLESSSTRCFWPLPVLSLGTFKQGVSKQGVTTFAWRPKSQYDVAATRGADTVLASDCRSQLGRPSTRRGCRICVCVKV